MRKVTPALALVGLGLSIAGPAVGAGTKTTTLQDDFFTRSKITVSKGTTVVWKWSTGEKHTVTDRGGKFSSKRTKSGNFKHRYAVAGTYRVFCKIHTGTMRQTIVVK